MKKLIFILLVLVPGGLTAAALVGVVAYTLPVRWVETFNPQVAFGLMWVRAATFPYVRRAKQVVARFVM